MSQATITLLTRRLIGGFAYFTEDASTYTPSGGGGAVTISDTVVPNYATDLDKQPSLGCIEQVAFSVDTDDQTYYCPRETGGYQRTIEHAVIADYIDLTTANDMELIQRLELGVPAQIVPGTPQTPFAQVDRSITGWLHLIGRKQDGAKLLTLTTWAEIRLQTNPPWSREPGRPVLRAQALSNSLNTVAWPAS